MEIHKLPLWTFVYTEIAVFGFGSALGGFVVDVIEPVLPLGVVAWRLSVICLTMIFMFAVAWFHPVSSRWLRGCLGPRYGIFESLSYLIGFLPLIIAWLWLMQEDQFMDQQSKMLLWIALGGFGVFCVCFTLGYARFRDNQAFAYVNDSKSEANTREKEPGMSGDKQGSQGDASPNIIGDHNQVYIITGPSQLPRTEEGGITWTSKSIQSPDSNIPHTLEITFQFQAEVNQVYLVVLCRNPILRGEWVDTGGFHYYNQNLKPLKGKEERSWAVKFDSAAPPFGPRKPLVIRIFSQTLIEIEEISRIPL